jgi:hypothetical protein
MTDADAVTFSLEQFFGGYFHQDWELDAADSDEVVERYLTDGPALSDEQALALAVRIEQLVDVYPEEELGGVLHDEWGSEYGVIEPETYTSWLTGIATRFRREAAKRE